MVDFTYSVKIRPGEERKCTEIVLVNVHPTHMGRGLGKEITKQGMEIAYQNKETNWIRIVAVDHRMRRTVKSTFSGNEGIEVHQFRNGNAVYWIRK